MAHVAALHCLLEGVNLLYYEKELLERGGDDIQQLHDLGETDFQQLCTSIGMASKPLHMMRFCKALHRENHDLTVIGPALQLAPPIGQSSLLSSMEVHPHISLDSDTPTSHTVSKTTILANSNDVLPRRPSSTQLHVSHCQPCKLEPIERCSPECPTPVWDADATGITTRSGGRDGIHNALSCDQITGCFHGTPYLSCPRNLPPPCKFSCSAHHHSCQHAPLFPNCCTGPSILDGLVDELTPVQSQLGPPPFSPSCWDAKRIELVRKSSVIYGQHTTRRKNVPLTRHEESVNNASFQLCLSDPTLLVRRDELFLLARRAVKRSMPDCSTLEQDGSQVRTSHILRSKPQISSSRDQEYRNRMSLNDPDMTQVVILPKRPHPDASECPDLTDCTLHGPPTKMSCPQHIKEPCKPTAASVSINTLTPVLLSQYHEQPSQAPYSLGSTTAKDLSSSQPHLQKVYNNSFTGTNTGDSSNKHRYLLWRTKRPMTECHGQQSPHKSDNSAEGCYSCEGSPGSLEECDSTFLASQTPVMDDLSPPFPIARSYSIHSDPYHLVECVNKSANEVVQLLSSFTKVD